MKTPGTCADRCEMLVAFADDELDASESAVVAEHIDHCPRCAAQVAALQRSLALARGIWSATLGERPTTNVARGNRGCAERLDARCAALIGAAAAVAAVLVGLWGMQPGTERQATAHASQRIEQIVRVEGISASLVASAELLAAAPGGEHSAIAQLQGVIKHYPASTGAARARERLRQ